MKQQPQKYQKQNNPTNTLEESLLSQGYDFVVGIDEAGRGPWAGPMHLGAYIYDNKEKYSINTLIKDSKLLSEPQRESCFLSLKPENRFFVSVSAKEIDEIGLVKVINISMLELILHVLALPKCEGKKIIALIDGRFRFKNLPIEYRSIIDGDRLHYAISCGAIVAKVTHDTEMHKIDKIFPQYDFKNNKGYGTKMHQLALEKYGICEEHRKTYKPIREFIAKREQSTKG